MSIHDYHTHQISESNREHLDHFTQEVKRVFPYAVKIGVTSSDQGRYGYVLTSITETVSEDRTVTETSTGGARFDDVDQSVMDELGDLSWGIFGDTNQDSSFEVDVETMRIIR